MKRNTTQQSARLILGNYDSFMFNPETPTGLFNKMQFDVRLYFFRRGAENMHRMTKNTFMIQFINGNKCVVKKMGELTKNHRETDTGSSGSGIMPAMANNVRSFLRNNAPSIIATQSPPERTYLEKTFL